MKMFTVQVNDQNNNEYAMLAWSDRLNDFVISENDDNVCEFTDKNAADYQAKRFKKKFSYLNFYTFELKK
jgi:hypothetical protein